MKKLNSLLILILITTILFAQDTTDNKFGSGLYNVVARDGSYSMKFAARMQSLYIGEWDVNDSTGIGAGSSQFLVRRARLKFGGFAFSPKVKYRIELGLANRDISGLQDTQKEHQE